MRKGNAAAIYNTPSLWLIIYSPVPDHLCHVCKQPIAKQEKCWQQFCGKRRGSRYFHFTCEAKLYAQG